MPFKSEDQRRFLWANHPQIAKKWAHKYGNEAIKRRMTKKDKK